MNLLFLLLVSVYFGNCLQYYAYYETNTDEKDESGTKSFLSFADDAPMERIEFKVRNSAKLV